MASTKKKKTKRRKKPQTSRRRKRRLHSTDITVDGVQDGATTVRGLTETGAGATVAVDMEAVLAGPIHGLTPGTSGGERDNSW